MNNKKHMEKLKLIKGNSTFITLNESSYADSQQEHRSSSTIALTSQRKNLSFTDQVTRAESLWAMNTARHGYSYLSCDESGDLFRQMFPDSKIAESFKIERHKLSYVISHGLGPFFHNDLVQDIKKCERFVLCFDEQKNKQNNKQLDMLFKYWSVEKQDVVTRYYKSVLLGHATAHIVKDSILSSFQTDGIDIKKLLMIGRDNPNVNKSIEKLIDTEMKKVGGELLEIGSCNIHVVHNAFKAGTTTSSWHIESFCIDLWSWFRHSPARKEDFVKVVGDLNESIEKNILYFVCTRWVLLGKVVVRILGQWDILKEYFLVYLPGNDKATLKDNKRYDSIKSCLSSNVSRTRLLFISFLGQTIFDKFLTLFQKSIPLIHLLYNELSDMFRAILFCFLTTDYVGNKKAAELLLIDFKIAEKQLNDKQIRIGEETRKSLTSLSREEKEEFFRDVRNIYHSIASYFKLNLPLNNSFLRDVQILGAAHRTNPDGNNAIVRIGRHIPGLLTANEIDLLADEWLLYSIETIDESWIVKKKQVDLEGNEQVEYYDIDYYWSKIFSIVRSNGYVKYPTLAKLVKNILIISHGNADVERGFSTNGNILTEDRTLLSEKSINGLRTTYGAVQYLGRGSAHKMSTNIDMVRAVQKSASLYKEEALKMKAIAEAQQREHEQQKQKDIEKKQMSEQEQELMLKYKTLQSEQKTAQLLLEEGTQRLEDSLKKGDFTDVQAAYALSKSGTEKMKSIDEEMTKIMNCVSGIQQKRAQIEREQANKKRKLV